MQKQISRTKIKSRIAKKTNPEITDTIRLALKSPAWLPVAKIIAGPKRLFAKVNLEKIDESSKTGDTVLIPGKVLALGTITKKLRIVALSISSPAIEKLKGSKSEFVTIYEEIKKNPKFQGVTILR